MKFSLQLLTVSCLAVCASSYAQEIPGADRKETPPPGVDKYYWDLSHSQDRVIKSLAERYLNATKVQEWTDLSGKFRTVARYVKHEPNLTTVTIEMVRGRGADRTTEQKTVPVDKLSKVCQSRVRQIDAMQKKLKDLVAAQPNENGTPGVPAGPGDPTGDALGAEPGSPVQPAEGAAPSQPTPPAEPVPDPSASEPDPLGFAELPEPPPPAIPAEDGNPAPPGTRTK